jgi:hypothetical protein
MLILLGDAPELAKMSLTLTSSCRTCYLPKGLKGCLDVDLPKRNHFKFLLTLNDEDCEIPGKRKIVPGNSSFFTVKLFTFHDFI